MNSKLKGSIISQNKGSIISQNKCSIISQLKGSIVSPPKEEEKVVVSTNPLDDIINNIPADLPTGAYSDDEPLLPDGDNPPGNN